MSWETFEQRWSNLTLDERREVMDKARAMLRRVRFLGLAVTAVAFAVSLSFYVVKWLLCASCRGHIPTRVRVLWEGARAAMLAGIRKGLLDGGRIPVRIVNEVLAEE